MLAEAVAALAATGANALVSAMVTDGWEGARERFARLFRRGAGDAAEGAAAKLDNSRAALAGVSGADLERVRAELVVAWRRRLEDLLEADPDAEPELRAVVAATQAQVTSERVHVEQRVTGSGRAQQGVLGHGVQTNTFGGQGGRGAGG